MLCRDVKRAVYLFLDGQLGEIKKNDFDSHLKLCPSCDARTKLQDRLRKFVRKRVDRINLTAPDRLKTRLARSIRAFQNEWSRPDGVLD